MAKIISVDMTGVESGGGGFTVIPEGDYIFAIKKVIKKTGDKGDYLRISFKATQGNPKGVGKTLDHICSLTKQSLWNLRNIMEAAGKTVPSKAIKIDLDKMLAWTVAGTVVDDEYNKKKKSTISAFFPVADFGKVDAEESDDSEDASDDAESEGEEAESEESEEAEELFD